MSYVVTSDNFALGTRGTTLSDEQLKGCNVEALVAGGHLAPAPGDVLTMPKKADPEPVQEEQE